MSENELPVGWTKTALQDICEIIAGQSPPSDTYNKEQIGLPFFQGKTDFGELYPTLRVYCSKPQKIAKLNDILLSVRAPVGPTNLSPGTVCIGRGLTAIRPLDTLNYKYVLFYFKLIESELLGSGTGTTFKAVNQDFIKSISVIVAPLPEQERIVAKIEELFSELDKGVETLKMIKRQLKVYRQAVLKEAFEGKLTDSKLIAEEKLETYIENPRYGTSKKCNRDNSTNYSPVYRIPNVDFTSGHINHDDIKYAKFTNGELKTLRLQKDDILIIRSNGSLSLVGRAALVREVDIKGVFAGYLIRLRLKKQNQLLATYLLHYLNSHDARTYIEQTAKSTSGVNNINAVEIKKMKIPVFNFTEQMQIVTEIDNRLSVCEKIEQIVDETLQKAESLRQSILKKAFEGKLVE